MFMGKTQYTTSGTLLRYMEENTVYNKLNATEIYGGKPYTTS